MKPMAQATRHGAPATGLAKAKLGGSGVYPASGSKYEQDIDRKTSESQTQAGPRGTNSGNSRVTQKRTGGQARKFAGKVGIQKATGTT